MKTQEEFYLANQVDGHLTDYQTMQMLGLPEGDSTQVQSNVPAVAAEPDEPETELVKVVEPEPSPVIMAKDGVHTIGYEKLVEARDGERAARAQVAELLQQMEVLKNATPAQAVAVAKAVEPAATPAEIADLFGDFSEEAIAKGVESLVSRRTADIEARFEAKFNSVLAPIQQKQADTATESHFDAINKAHPDVESVVASAELAQWIASQPSFARSGYQAAIAQGTAAEVIEALDAYKAATGRLTAAPGKPDAAAAAQAAIAKAQSAPPLSLSDIPASSSAAVDEAAAVLEMSSVGMMNNLSGKTPEQIRNLMSRLL